jgi:hypothetical protein
MNNKEWKVCRVRAAAPGDRSGGEADRAAEKFAAYLTEIGIAAGEAMPFLQRVDYASTLTFLIYTDKDVRDIDVNW